MPYSGDSLVLGIAITLDTLFWSASVIMEKTIRAFVAVELPVEVVRIAAAVQRQLKSFDLRLSWVKPQQIHLTLKFLGEITVGQIPAAITALEHAARNCAPSALMVQEMGLFPNLRRPRVLWMGLSGEVEQLRGLQIEVEDGFAVQGFGRESRSFKAHLTLARIPEGADAVRVIQALERVERWTPQPFVVAEMVLFQSELRSQGALHTPLFRTSIGLS